MLVVGLVNLASPSYGGDFLRMMGSIYPGFHDSRTISEVLLGTVYGIIDGAILGLCFGLLYRWISRGSGKAISPAEPSAISGAPLRRAS
jgi:NhaP-type Na+/H+ or K+/H+ antiporter